MQKNLKTLFKLFQVDTKVPRIEFYESFDLLKHMNPVDTGRKLNADKTCVYYNTTVQVFILVLVVLKTYKTNVLGGNINVQKILLCEKK